MMGLAQEKLQKNPNGKFVRSAYDRRAGNDRRSLAPDNYKGIEKRRLKERREIFQEKRSGWVRDTKWSSINLDLLRY